MNILCIDPGPTTSGVVLLDVDAEPLPRILKAIAKCENAEILSMLAHYNDDEDGPLTVVIERFACMGMAVGEETLEAVHWGGRFHQEAVAWKYPVARIKRHEVKMTLCGNTRAKDGNIRQAIIDMYGGDGAIGTKKSPGPLYGMSADAWAAMAVGLTHVQHEEKSA
jgi:hypothetical protein